MKENFSIEIPRNPLIGKIPIYLISFMISLIIVYTTIGFKNIVMSILCILILALLFYIIVSSYTLHNGLSTETTTYPVPPHLGLDGISMNNLVSGL
jgi:hypothetical protein